MQHIIITEEGMKSHLLCPVINEFQALVPNGSM